MIVKRPVSASLARAFFYIVLLSILSTGIALLTLASSLRDAEAINIAGSLRMQSYRLGYDLQSGSPQLNAHRQLFQQALHSPVLTNLNVWYVPEAVKTRYAHLNANWLEMNNRLSKGDLPWYQANINNYVNQIDLFVLALQHYAERKMLLVVAISLAGGIGIFTLVFFTLRRIRHQVVAPLISWLPPVSVLNTDSSTRRRWIPTCRMSLACLQKPLTRCRASCINCTFRWRRQ